MQQYHPEIAQSIINNYLPLFNNSGSASSCCSSNSSNTIINGAQCWGFAAELCATSYQSDEPAPDVRLAVLNQSSSWLILTSFMANDASAWTTTTSTPTLHVSRGKNEDYNKKEMEVE